jgi:phosphatidylglycerophosphatase C
MILALFDFDGTITTKDSLKDFIQHAVGKSSYYKGLLLLSPLLVAYICKIVPNYKAKEYLFSYFFSGWNTGEFQAAADDYSLLKIDKIVRVSAIKRIQWHKDQGHDVVIVSASIESWLSKWCMQQKIQLIGTKIEILDGHLTGKFSTKNCYGLEKVNRVNERFDLKRYNEIYAYGDSGGDKEMLKLADHSHYCFFGK